MMRIIVFMMAFLFACAGAQAQDTAMRIELAEGRVDITTGFNGTRVIMFGTIKGGEAGLAVTLKGPERTIVARRKEKALGTWVNRSSVEFRRVPSYYDYAVQMTGAGADDVSALFRENQIGVDNLAFYPEDADEDAAVVESFSDALIRNMQEKGVYALKPKSPVMLGDGFFKVSFDLPPGVPTGIYTVEAMAIRDGAIAARESKTLQVGQVGFNVHVFICLLKDIHFYGIASVLIALVSGWAAFTFLRRD